MIYWKKIYWIIDCNDEVVDACTTEEEAKVKAEACNGYWCLE